MLSERRVLVGVCGSIAAYKSAELVRELGRGGAEVRAVMTPSAARFVGPATLAALTSHEVHVDLFEAPERVIHVELARWAQCYVICGATASTLARLAAGSGEDLVSATALMCRCPVVVAPAMHTEMWEHPAVARNVDRVRSDGARMVEPGVGDLASGDVGVGRLAEVADIAEEVRRALTPDDLAGLDVLITAGPTREALDPVRFISNRSSGRMGFALAADALRRGARVTIVCGPTSLSPPRGADVVRVESAEQMLQACLDRFDDCDVAVMNAAVADYRPATTATEKVRKADMEHALVLVRTTDIAAELGRKKGSQTVVAFAAETNDLAERGRGKLETKHADLVVANEVAKPGTGFDTETNRAILITAREVEQLPLLTKRELSARVWDKIVKVRDARAR